MYITEDPNGDVRAWEEKPTLAESALARGEFLYACNDSPSWLLYTRVSGFSSYFKHPTFCVKLPESSYGKALNRLADTMSELGIPREDIDKLSEKMVQALVKKLGLED